MFKNICKQSVNFYSDPDGSILSLIRVEQPRITKDVICFHAEDFLEVVQRMQLDLHEPPLSQVSSLIDSPSLTTVIFLIPDRY